MRVLRGCMGGACGWGIVSGTSIGHDDDIAHHDCDCYVDPDDYARHVEYPCLDIRRGFDCGECGALAAGCIQRLCAGISVGDRAIVRPADPSHHCSDVYHSLPDVECGCDRVSALVLEPAGTGGTRAEVLERCICSCLSVPVRTQGDGSADELAFLEAQLVPVRWYRRSYDDASTVAVSPIAFVGSWAAGIRGCGAVRSSGVCALSIFGVRVQSVGFAGFGVHCAEHTAALARCNPQLHGRICGEDELGQN